MNYKTERFSWFSLSATSISETSVSVPNSDQKQESHISPSENDKNEPEVEEEEPCPFEMKKIDTGTYIISLFAKNLYNFKIYALVLAFFINFMLLFYEVLFWLMMKITIFTFPGRDKAFEWPWENEFHGPWWYGGICDSEWYSGLHGVVV